MLKPFTTISNSAVQTQGMSCTITVEAFRHNAAVPRCLGRGRGQLGYCIGAETLLGKQGKKEVMLIRENIVVASIYTDTLFQK